MSDQNDTSNAIQHMETLAAVEALAEQVALVTEYLHKVREAVIYIDQRVTALEKSK